MRSPPSSRHPSSTSRQRLGRESEQLAIRLLASRGYRVERTNVRVPVGEIDVVAWEGQTLCFVEVRSTTSERWGGAQASITWPKQRRLIRAAQWYLSRLRPLPAQVRFDVVAIGWDGPRAPRAELIPGAFTADGID